MQMFFFLAIIFDIGFEQFLCSYLGPIIGNIRDPVKVISVIFVPDIHNYC